MTHTNCPVCGAAGLEERNEIMRMQFEGEWLEYESQYLFCGECEAETVTPEQIGLNKRAVMAAKCRHLGIPSTEELHGPRRKRDMNQQQAGELLGVGMAMFRKCENFPQLPSAPTTRLVRVVLYRGSVEPAFARKQGVMIAYSSGFESHYVRDASAASIEWLNEHHAILATTSTFSYVAGKGEVSAGLFNDAISPSTPLLTDWALPSSLQSVGRQKIKTNVGETHGAYH